MSPRRKTAVAGKIQGRKARVKSSAQLWPADHVERRAVSSLTAYAENPRVHSDEQVAEIARSMQEWGWTVPVLIDEAGGIIAGHGRVMAAEKLGLVDIPVMVAKGWSEAQKRAYIIADNQIPQNATWDQTLLRVNLTALAKLDYNLNLTGFDNVRLATFIGAAPGGGGDPNEIPHLAPAISKLGDVWLMGDHRLICGDSSNDKAVAKLLGKDEPKVMVTDPPYKYSGENGGNFYNRGNYKKLLDADKLADFEISKLPDLLETNIIFTSKELLAEYLDLAREKKMKWDLPVLHRSAAIPNHSNHLTTDLDYIVLMGKIAPKNGLDHCDYSKLFSMAAWDRPVPWAKPVELIERILRLYSVAGDMIFEPYAGSFTTGIACEQLGRVCLAAEINPEYVDLAVRRWQKLANSKAVLQGTKRTFDQIEKERSRKAA